MLTFEIFSLDDNYLDWMILPGSSNHPVLSFDVWLHWNRTCNTQRYKGSKGYLNTSVTPWEYNVLHTNVFYKRLQNSPLEE